MDGELVLLVLFLRKGSSAIEEGAKAQQRYFFHGANIGILLVATEWKCQAKPRQGGHVFIFRNGEKSQINRRFFKIKTNAGNMDDAPGIPSSLALCF